MRMAMAADNDFVGKLTLTRKYFCDLKANKFHPALALTVGETEFCILLFAFCSLITPC
jgi:hypothetical protein